MTDRKQHDDELEQYLKGDSSVSKQYQSLSTGEPSATVDNAILAAARSAVQHQSTSTRGYRWYIPASLAAGILIVSVMITFKFHPPETFPDGSQINAQAQPKIEQKLIAISDLLAQGKTQQAAQDYERFKRLYPDYPIDYQQYPSLQQLENHN